jgi:hypothetical protein
VFEQTVFITIEDPNFALPRLKGTILQSQTISQTHAMNIGDAWGNTLSGRYCGPILTEVACIGKLQEGSSIQHFMK